MSYVVRWVEGADPKDAGTLAEQAQTAAGVTTIEVNATTGDVTIEHAAGTKVIVKSDAVYLGDDGALPLVKDTPFQAWAATVVSALGALGGFVRENHIPEVVM